MLDRASQYGSVARWQWRSRCRAPGECFWIDGSSRASKNDREQGSEGRRARQPCCAGRESRRAGPRPRRDRKIDTRDPTRPPPTIATSVSALACIPAKYKRGQVKHSNITDVEALRFLEQVADDPEEDVRSRTAYAMGKLGDRAAVPILREMLADQRWTVRANAVQALGKLGDPSVRPALERMLEDPNTQVRATAEAALGTFP